VVVFLVAQLGDVHEDISGIRAESEQTGPRLNRRPKLHRRAGDVCHDAPLIDPNLEALAALLSGIAQIHVAAALRANTAVVVGRHPNASKAIAGWWGIIRVSMIGAKHERYRRRFDEPQLCQVRYDWIRHFLKNGAVLQEALNDPCVNAETSSRLRRR
jgi:hypothetical protein